MRKIFLITLILTYCAGYAQKMTGRIMNDKEQPLVYANIGVKNKPIGAISNEKGYFDINTQGTQETDSLVISYLGYGTKVVPLGFFKKNKIIVLNSSSTQLTEVFVTNNPRKKGKNKVWGNTSRSKNILTGWNGISRGEESGLVIKNKKQVDINQICFELAHNSFKTAKFRLRIRNVIDGLPADNLLNKNIFIDVREPKKYCVSLEDLYISTESSFFVGLELISVKIDRNYKGERQRLNLSGTLTGKKLYYKETSAGHWIKYGLPGPSIQAHVTKY